MANTAFYATAASAVVAVGLGAGAWLALTGDAHAECGGGMATGAASIGGPFMLTSHTGAPVTEADLITRPTLIYFGYTFCPDVCPLDVAVMAEAKRILDAGGREVGAAFITIDPARDTQEVLAEFVDVMHPDMIALTGDDAQIETAASAYRVFYQMAEGDDPDYYLMDHSAFTYLMGPDGFLEVFRHGVTPDEMAEAAACHIDQFTGA